MRESRRRTARVHRDAGEACERFSFHGVASILALVLADQLYAERDAKVGYHLFLAAVSIAPLLGPWIAARFGRGRIAWAPYACVAGCAVLGVWASRAGLTIGLALLAAGAAGFEPPAGFATGRSGREDRFPLERARASRSIVALAAVGSMLVVPLVLLVHGRAAAFAVPAVAFAIGGLGRGLRRRAAAPSLPPDPHGFARVVGRALKRLGTGHPGQHWLELASDAHPAEAVEGAKAVFRLAGVFAVLGVFRALFDQQGSSWVFQARGMDLSLAGLQLSPAQLQALDPLLVVALAAILASAVLPALARRGLAPSPQRRVTAGMVATALSFAAAGIVQTLLDSGHLPHALWQLPQHVLLAAGDVLVSLSALELVRTRAPRTMRGTIARLWLLTAVAGNLLTTGVVLVLPLGGAAWFWFFAALALAAALGWRALERARRTLPVEDLAA
jgi:POT family proton-dependent oligopeptide transporter